MIFIFVFGKSGLIERMQLIKQNRLLEDENQKLEAENKRLQELYDTYKSGKYKLEDAEKYGFIKKGSKVIIFEDFPDPKDKEKDINIDNLVEKSKIKLKYLRYFWIILSAVIILLTAFLTFRDRGKDKEE